MILKSAHYLSNVRDRIPLKRCLGYHYTSDVCLLVLFISDVVRFFFRWLPWAELLLSTAICISISTFAIIGICSNKQSIINLLPECPRVKGNVGWTITIMYLSAILLPIFCFFLFVGGDSATISIIHTIIVNCLILLYWGCQYYILWRGNEFLEMAAEGMSRA